MLPFALLRFPALYVYSWCKLAVGKNPASRGFSACDPARWGARRSQEQADLQCSCLFIRNRKCGSLMICSLTDFCRLLQGSWRGRWYKGGSRWRTGRAGGQAVPRPGWRCWHRRGRQPQPRGNATGRSSGRQRQGDCCRREQQRSVSTDADCTARPADVRCFPTRLVSGSCSV